MAKTQSDAPDWQNQHLLQRNREPAHATLLPCPDEASARTGERAASPWFKLLSGTWDFCYVESPAAVPEGFEQPAFDVAGWDALPVPSNWQMHDYGRPNYSNVRYPYPVDPPFVATARGRTCPPSSTSPPFSSPVRTSWPSRSSNGRTARIWRTRISGG